MSQEKWEPCICFNTFQDFCNYKFARNYLEFGIKKHEKNWNLGPKTLRKPGILYLEKSGNPDNLNFYVVLKIFKDIEYILSLNFSTKKQS